MIDLSRLDNFSRAVLIAFAVAGAAWGLTVLSAHDAKRAVRSTLAQPDRATFGRFDNRGETACLEVTEGDGEMQVAVLKHGPIAWQLVETVAVPFRACQDLLTRSERRRADPPPEGSASAR